MDIVGIHVTEITHTVILMGSDQNGGTPQMVSVMARMMIHHFICAIKNFVTTPQTYTTRQASCIICNLQHLSCS